MARQELIPESRVADALWLLEVQARNPGDVAQPSVTEIGDNGAVGTAAQVLGHPTQVPQVLVGEDFE